MHDDVNSDWLAQELKEEHYRGCMAHNGSHSQGHAPGKDTWDGRAMKREKYNPCEEHDGIHQVNRQKYAAPPNEKREKYGAPSRRKNPLLTVVVAIMLFNLLFNVIIPMLMNEL